MLITAEDIEAGTRMKFQTEPTLPIFLKVLNFEEGHKFHKNHVPALKYQTLVYKQINFYNTYLNRQGWSFIYEINATQSLNRFLVLYKVTYYMAFMYKTSSNRLKVKKILTYINEPK